MKTGTKAQKRAFTLIELLVVIAVIALLLAILVPALSRVKEYAWRVICGNNIRSQATGIRLYSEQNDGAVPLNEGGYWLQDITFWCTNQITAYSGVDYKSFFCPANKIRKPDDARFWQYSLLGSNPGLYPGANPSAGPVTCLDESTLTLTQVRTNYRVMAYNYMFERMDRSTPPQSINRPTLLNGTKAIWITKISSLTNSSSTYMIVDNTLSAISAVAPDYNKAPASGCNFVEVSGGLRNWGIYDSTNHLARQIEGGLGTRKDAAGGNCAFADGHVEWKNRREIKCLYQLNSGTPYFWW